MKTTAAALQWLARAKHTLGPERYSNLVRHIQNLTESARVRVTKRICKLALIRLWADEGLPITL